MRSAVRPISEVSASFGRAALPRSSTTKPRMALAQEKAIQAKVSAKKVAKSTCSVVTFTGLMT